jgi:cytochrome c oxidase assembly factor CtaG
VPLALSAIVASLGWWRLLARSALGATGLRWRGGCFLAGWAVLAGALVSPLHEAGERSFAMHMAEHELLMLVAAPLLVLSRPLAVMLWALPLPLRRALGGAGASAPVATIWQGLTAPVLATALQAAALWLWHMPLVFDVALANAGWHAAQHLSFLVSALLFWTAMLRGHDSARRGTAILCLFATAMISGALGALMALSASPWYKGYAELGMAPFGLTPAEDQQVAGLLMWVPGGLVHAAAALLLMRTLLRDRPQGRLAHAG